MKPLQLIPGFRLLQIMFVLELLFAILVLPLGDMWYNIVAELCLFIMIGGIIAFIEIYIFEINKKYGRK